MTQEEEFVDDDSHPMETSSLKRRGSKRRSARLKQTGRQGSIMSDYFDSPKSSRDHSFRMESVEFEESGDVSYLDANHNLQDNAAADGPITTQQMFEATPSDSELANSYASPAGDSFIRQSNLITSTPESARRHYGGRETSESELDEEYSQHARSARLYSKNLEGAPFNRSAVLSEEGAPSCPDAGLSEEGGPWCVDSRLSDDVSALKRPRSVAEEMAALERDLSDSVEYDKIRQSPRKEPVGANSTADARLDGMGEEDLSGKSPERVFKVVFVGDSGVGKSSFIHRFCSNTFKHTFSATIGVDFQVKNVRVDNHLIALQLWDTAGQERFRSITKQYFRKADGVFIMYDVTSETSFKNVRNWMISVQDGTEEGTVLAMIGNKIDLVEDEETRVVTTKDGAKLADEYGALFYETSARSGSCVRDSMQGVASLLREREDRELEKTLNVNEDILPKKKGCCD